MDTPLYPDPEAVLDSGSNPDCSASSDPVTELLIAYDELNSPHIDELFSEPSPLEFMRYVARNRPFVVRGGAKSWRAVRTWNVKTLKEVLDGQSVNVAVTPFGNADSPMILDDGTKLFVKPWEEQQPFSEFLDYIISQEKSGSFQGEVRYAQTQNDNLRNEYAHLFSDVQKDIPWARIALNQDPEAINLWIGNSQSTTALHKDNYENIYVQIIGQKHFVLLPPLSYPCVAEAPLRPASYIRCPDPPSPQPHAHNQSWAKGLDIAHEGEGPLVPFATWDPDASDDRKDEVAMKTRYSERAHRVRVTLNPGDMLYLPTLWYHKVTQSCSGEGLCVAVNYWHDMEFSGGFYSMVGFVKSVAEVEKKKEKIPHP